MLVLTDDASDGKLRRMNCLNYRNHGSGKTSLNTAHLLVLGITV